MQVVVARIGKPHGIRGEVTVELFTDSPQERLAPGEQLVVEGFDRDSPASRLAHGGRLIVAGYRWNKKIPVVRFEGVDTRNDAEVLRNLCLLAQVRADDTSEGYYEHDLIGLPVYVLAADRDLPGREEVGKVRGLQTMPAQDLLLIELPNGQEAMIPFVRELVPEVNLQQGFVLIAPPPGLLNVEAAGAVLDRCENEGR